MLPNEQLKNRKLCMTAVSVSISCCRLQLPSRSRDRRPLKTLSKRKPGKKVVVIGRKGRSRIRPSRSPSRDHFHQELPNAAERSKQPQNHPLCQLPGKGKGENKNTTTPFEHTVFLC
jgi:hypothetical protein